MTLIPSIRTSLQIAFVFLLATASASAQATRTWVSGVGDDANPCSRTAPCKTFAGAISKTATNGEINVLDPGGFGALTITKSISINGTPVVAGVLVSGTNGLNVVNNTGSQMNVTIRGLDIDGLGTGLAGVSVSGNSPTTVHIENSQIYGFGQAVNVAPGTGGSAAVSITHTRISECAGASSSGINADGTNGAVNVSVLDTEVRGCPTGLNLLGGAKVNARLSDFSQNTTGVTVSDASVALLDSGTIAYCTTAVNAATAGAVIRLSNMTISDNTTGLSASGGSIVSFSNNRIKGNTTNGAPTSTIYQN